MSYQCPLCHQALTQHAHQWRCANNHQFDLAKEGYVNLMPAHHKNSKNPGDSAEMMQARRRFLNEGHYAPLKDKLVALLDEHIAQEGEALLDIGCGEGYYTEGFAQLQAQRPAFTIHGLDIAKVAIRYAAKRYPQCQFSVASSHRLPFADHSLAGVVKIYAPCKPEELLRTLTPDGLLVTVTPAPRHMYQLKALIYDEVRLHDTEMEKLPGFRLIERHDLHYTMRLGSQSATDLLQMTPFAWRASESVWQTLAEAELTECEAHFCIRLYQPDQPQDAQPEDQSDALVSE
uniref:23S rRNA (guanine(745)-N(1))-methyltransferase n=1 Tax=Thaumasiovibrio occultus TaxID=1891184 RepID=UPI000B35F6A3|nr:23S rRNA (guanine(745)-N(1))-methyltransferase [Thaumasiovibrio occultus]